MAVKIGRKVPPNIVLTGSEIRKFIALVFLVKNSFESKALLTNFPL